MVVWYRIGYARSLPSAESFDSRKRAFRTRELCRLLTVALSDLSICKGCSYLGLRGSSNCDVNVKLTMQTVLKCARLDCWKRETPEFVATCPTAFQVQKTTRMFRCIWCEDVWAVLIILPGSMLGLCALYRL